jgi:peptidoglycan/xylan/chitin deacetylase (PgdA/CDA1 family)
MSGLSDGAAKNRVPKSGAPKLAVLMYHSISEPPDHALRDLAVPAPRLYEQLAALSNDGYALLGLSDALARLTVDPRARVVAVTFDDGYRNLLSDGLSVLATLDAGVTLYMSAGHVGGTAAWLGAQADAFGPLLTWQQLREVASAGVEIGNHGLRHQPLDVLPRADVATQVRTSRDLLEQQVQAPMRTFAYPHGYHDARVRSVVAETGHVTACEVGRRRYRLGDQRLAISRLQLTVDDRGPDALRLVRTGGPKFEPAVKRAAQPGWRLVRRVARDVFGRHLT